MQDKAHPAIFRNRLLAGLPDQDHREVLANCDSVELRRNELISEHGERIRHVYFPTDSFLSLSTPTHAHAGLEVHLVGDEGMIGTPLLVGIEESQLRSTVLGGGPAWCMTTELFQDALRKSRELRESLNRYLFVLTRQGEQMVACARFHVLEARLARWLLMAQDRTHANQLHVTHESLAVMLGVRRVGVTKAATALQLRNLIHYHRGDITIVDRPGLEDAACFCYGEAESLYSRIMG